MKDYLRLNNELMRRENGFYQLEKDKEAVTAFEQEVEERMMKFENQTERFYWLISNDYYIDYLKDYSAEFISELAGYVYSFHFKFQSFMAISKFYQSYALKTNDKKYYLERYEDRIVAVALGLARGNKEKAKALATVLIKQEYQPATPTFMNVGKKRGGEMVSCFLLEMDDSLNSINYNINTAGQLSKIGGGVAINLSKLRGRNESIKGIENASSGVIPVAKIMEHQFSYVNQLGQRNGAGVANLNIFHWDIEEFLDTKKVNADEKSRLQTLSIGVIIPNKFMELAERGEKAYVFAPHTVYQELGEYLDDLDMSVWYDKLVSTPSIKKREIDARKLLTQIARTQFESGYPYVMYKDNANKVHALKNIGDIKQSNLCVTGDTRLHTTQGMKTAKELYELGNNLQVVVDKRTKEMNANDKGTEVVSALPMTLTAKEADIYQIQTQHGYSIKATEWHKFYREVNGEIEKVSLNELEIGDKLLIQSDDGAYGSFDDTELAYLMGLMSGDGCIDENTAICYLYGDKKTLVPKVEAIIQNVIEKYYQEEKTHHSAVLKPTFNMQEDRAVLASRPLAKVLSQFGMAKETKTSVPECIFGGTKEVVGAYLSGLYQMDGTVNASVKYKAMSYELKSIDKKFVQDLQILLANAGVFTTIYEEKAKNTLLSDGKGGTKNYNVKTPYKLSIQDRISRDRFNSFVTLKDRDEEKIAEMNATLAPTSRQAKHQYRTVITSIEFVGVEDVYDTHQPDYHSLIFNGIVTGNCQEIMQLQETSIINNYGEDDVIKRDISCNLGSLNLVNVIEADDFEELMLTAMDALSTVSDLSELENAPGVKKANRELHSVGLGLMNLHGFLAKNKVAYESDLAREFVDVFFEMVNFYSIKASCQLAVEKGESFVGFEQSEYSNGKYFDKYLVRQQPNWSERVKALLGKQSAFIPTQQDWSRLKHWVQENGLYNAYRLAIAPTQSIGYVQNATPSIAPIVDVIERRTYGDSTTYYPMPYLAMDNFFFYKSAYNMDMEKYLQLIAKAQFHVDQGISTVLYVDTNTTTRELVRLYVYAWKLGLKSLYYTRVKNLDVTECEACSV